MTPVLGWTFAEDRLQAGDRRAAAQLGPRRSGPDLRLALGGLVAGLAIAAPYGGASSQPAPTSEGAAASSPANPALPPAPTPIRPVMAPLIAPMRAASGAGSESDLTASERFAERIAEQPSRRARATPAGDLSTVAAEGTIISAVLETAINSDLPGFTRAVVSRPVTSFDGRAILIPRGSRLIGQYESAAATGQSRAFVVWTRVIRPDGVSIQIASPSTDVLGRGGLAGTVDRHLAQRFGGAVLLTLLNAGVASVDGRPSTQITIGGAGAPAVGPPTVADRVSPTILIAPGTAIRVFLTRDLDFSTVGPAG